MNKFPVYLFVALYYLFVSSFVYAQTQGMVDKLQNFKQLIDGSDPLKKALGTVDRMKENFKYNEKNIPLDAQKILSNLRNPFVSQLPVPFKESPVMPKPTPIPLPLSISPTSTPMPEVTITAMPVQPPPSFKLSGLVWNSDLPQAIIDGNVLKEGESINNWTVAKISKEGVQLNYQDRTIFLTP